MSINYTEKGLGQHQAVADAGHTLWNEDGIWYSSNDAVVQPLLDAYGLPQVVAEIQNQIAAFANTLFIQAAQDYTAQEMATWGVCYMEAQQYIANPSASVPNLTLEATTSGQTVSALAEIFVAKGNAYLQAKAQIAGTRTLHYNNVAVLTDISSALAYNFTTGWPKV